MSRSISFEYEFEEVGMVLNVEAEIEKGDPGQYYGPPENCYPGTGPEIQELSAEAVCDDGSEIEISIDDISIKSRDGKWVVLSDLLGELAVEKFNEGE